MNGPEPAPAVPGWYGRALVLLQFTLLGMLAWHAGAAAALTHRAAPWALAVALLAAAAALGLWALAANRPGNFNIRPEPRQGAALVTTGPYRWIRHPMYSAVLLAAAALALMAGDLAAGLLWLALLAVLLAKARLEEQALLRCFAGYAAYRTQTKRFLPGLV